MTEEINRIITNRSRIIKRKLIAEFRKLNIKHVARSPSPVPSVTQIKDSFKKSIGIINRMTYQFPQHMVFVHKGVGKGTTAAQVGKTSRKPKEWFNPIVEEEASVLANQLADKLVDINFATISKILIK